MANTTLLKTKIVRCVRDWLASKFSKPFHKESLFLKGVKDRAKKHEFDAVSQDRKIVCGIKTASWKTGEGGTAAVAEAVGKRPDESLQRPTGRERIRPTMAGTRKCEGQVQINPPAERLGEVNAIFSGVARRHAVRYTGPLSVKTMLAGRAVWGTAESQHSVNEKSFVILNDRTTYSLTMDSLQPARTFVLFFRRGFVEDVHRSLVASPRALLDEPFEAAFPTHFVEVVQPGALSGVQRAVTRVYRAWQAGATAGRLEDEFWNVAVEMLRLQHVTAEAVAGVPALKTATQLELFKRVERARARIEECYAEMLPLEELARDACLSAFHFHRTFRETFGVTPHQYVVRRRLAEAARLLRASDLPVAIVCARTGFESVNSFSSLFRRRFAAPPGKFRAAHQRSKSR